MNVFFSFHFLCLLIFIYFFSYLLLIVSFSYLTDPTELKPFSFFTRWRHDKRILCDVTRRFWTAEFESQGTGVHSRFFRLAHRGREIHSNHRSFFSFLHLAGISSTREEELCCNNKEADLSKRILR